MTDFGTDVSTFPVTDMTGRTISGKRVVLERLLRRFMTPNGTLDYDPSFGEDLRYLLNGDFTDSELRQAEAAAARQALLDEAIVSAWVQFTLDKQTSKLTVRIGGELADGSRFEGVLAIGSVTGDILAVI